MRFQDKRFLDVRDVGKTRKVTKFLILPLSILGETRWLEKCTYEEIVIFKNHELKTYCWFPHRWLD